ncbi:phosphoenolpyruvate carboxykinase [Chlorella sorokiniana]|uniref:Phosphoenolpyruvate carboxykinase n=1 Tax=Chlorella sorokiniana TaxID=3076 RepID=A0A2P6TY86_CHLSO|nr:phosphoenolpyruvate carboxykinase [Chlorella sorokiniana]|eukprot:PRW59021.1 phosphoenolpyruvate carboxykinase [Chlorella sorokiniana]
MPSARLLLGAAALLALCSSAAASDIATPAPYEWIQTSPDNYQILISLLNSSVTATKLFQQPPPNTAFLLPTDATFESLMGANTTAAEEALLDLIVMDPAARPEKEVEALLLNYIVNGSFPSLKLLVASSPVTTLGGAKISFEGEPVDSPFLVGSFNSTGPQQGGSSPQPAAASAGLVVAWKDGCMACQADPAFISSGMQCLFGCEGVTVYEVAGGAGLLLSD